GSNSRSQALAQDKAVEFTLEGLRTLVYCARQLSAEDYHQLLADHRAALSSLGKDRSVALEASMLKIESGLEIVGVTGVEDRLQTGVKECLQDLRDAGIQKRLTVLLECKLRQHSPKCLTAKVVSDKYPVRRRTEGAQEDYLIRS
ncbi:hypothetical protein P879_10776, partial [Paragonimus westermani]